MRLCVRGLSNQVTKADLHDLFKHYGSVTNVFIAKDSAGQCRGFGFASIDFDEVSFSKCASTLNAATWKASKLRIEKAGPDFPERLAADREKLENIKTNADRRRKWTRYAADMSLINERNFAQRPGWKRGRFGQPVLLVRLRKYDGSLVTFDPSHFVNDHTRFNESYRPRSVSSLTWHTSVSLCEVQNVNPPSEHSEVESLIEMRNESLTVKPFENTEPIPVDSHQDDAGFSLSKLLNLPMVVQDVNPTPSVTEFVQFPPQVQGVETLLDLSVLFKKTMLQPSADFPSEPVDKWRAQRPDIRRDFKSQMKESRRKSKKHRIKA